jgi:Uma2 family endonuclease
VSAAFRAPAPEYARPDPAARWRFSADEFLRMVDAKIFGEDDRVELVRGEILQVTPQGPEHRTIKDELHTRLARAYESRGAHVLNQGPLRAGPEGMPEPDLAVLRGGARDYLHRHPEGTDVLLVVEIAKSSQQRDRAKAADYAFGGVPVYWLLDIDARTLDVFSEPDRERGIYRRVQTLVESDEVTLPTLDEGWKIATLLP